jgi:hypothetical protein
MDELQRNLWCVHYPFCLDVHVRYCKRKFTCLRCKRYKPIHIEAEEVVEEAVRCGEFLHALFFGVDPYPRGDGMRRKIPEQEMVTVPAHLVKGFIYSLNWKS